jgi:hypothetical protein
MANARHGGQAMFRVWAAEYAGWRPSHATDVPPLARAIEPIEENCLSADEARAMVESFNQQMLSQPDQVWAVAVEVSIRYDGDPEPGETVQGHAFQAAEAI